MGKNISFRIKVILWVLSTALVIVIGVIYFPKEMKELNFWGALYYTIRLFIFENDLPSFPTSTPLVFIYFFAPLVALSVAGSAVNYFFRVTPGLRIKWTSDHVIICGVGRTGKIIAEALVNSGVSVVGIDFSDPEHFEEWRTKNRVPMVFGDFLSMHPLKKAGVNRARAVIFASGDDLANLEGVVSLYGYLKERSGPVRILWTHIANEKLADTARTALRTRGKIGIRIFDSYHIAAAGMVAKYFQRKNRQGYRKILVLGFGQFGRDLVEVLVKDAGEDEKWWFHIVDKNDRKKDITTLARDLDIMDRVTFTKCDIKDLELKNIGDVAYFLCTDDDIGNLATALTLSGKINGHNIYVRMANWPMPAIEHHISAKRGITFVNINDLIEKGIRELPGIFTSPKPSDLKRITDT